MTTDTEYLALVTRISGLKERRAVLLAKEQEKAQERQTLHDELKRLGIDPERPDEEIARLEAEIRADHERALSAANQFEAELNGKAPAPSIPAAPIPVQPATPSGPVLDLEI